MFSEKYPNLHWWVTSHGWIELGADEYSTSLLRILDSGGMCWEAKRMRSLDKALEKGDRWVSAEIINRFGDTPPKVYK